MNRRILFLGLLAMCIGPIGLSLAQPADDALPPPHRGPHGQGMGPGPQTEPPGGSQFILKMYDRVTRQLPDQLDLTLEQTDKYKTMVKEHRKSLEAIVKQLEQEQSKFESDLNAILTPEQQAKLKEQKKAREQAMKGMHQRSEAGDRGLILEKAVKKLNLPAEKNEKIQKILDESKKQFQEKKGDPQARRQIMKDTMDKIRNELSPDEMNKLRSIMREERGFGAGRGGPGMHRQGRGFGGPEHNAPPPADSD